MHFALFSPIAIQIGCVNIHHITFIVSVFLLKTFDSFFFICHISSQVLTPFIVVFRVCLTATARNSTFVNDVSALHQLHLIDSKACTLSRPARHCLHADVIYRRSEQRERKSWRREEIFIDSITDFGELRKMYLNFATKSLSTSSFQFLFSCVSLLPIFCPYSRRCRSRYFWPSHVQIGFGCVMSRACRRLFFLFFLSLSRSHVSGEMVISRSSAAWLLHNIKSATST